MRHDSVSVRRVDGCLLHLPSYFIPPRSASAVITATLRYTFRLRWTAVKAEMRGTTKSLLNKLSKGIAVYAEEVLFVCWGLGVVQGICNAWAISGETASRPEAYGAGQGSIPAGGDWPLLLLWRLLGWAPGENSFPFFFLPRDGEAKQSCRCKDRVFLYIALPDLAQRSHGVGTLCSWG